MTAKKKTDAAAENAKDDARNTENAVERGKAKKVDERFRKFQKTIEVGASEVTVTLYEATILGETRAFQTNNEMRAWARERIEALKPPKAVIMCKRTLSMFEKLSDAEVEELGEHQEAVSQALELFSRVASYYV